MAVPIVVATVRSSAGATVAGSGGDGALRRLACDRSRDRRRVSRGIGCQHCDRVCSNGERDLRRERSVCYRHDVVVDLYGGRRRVLNGSRHGDCGLLRGGAVRGPTEREHGNRGILDEASRNRRGVARGVGGDDRHEVRAIDEGDRSDERAARIDGDRRSVGGDRHGVQIGHSSANLNGVESSDKPGAGAATESVGACVSRVTVLVESALLPAASTATT